MQKAPFLFALFLAYSSSLKSHDSADRMRADFRILRERKKAKA